MLRLDMIDYTTEIDAPVNDVFTFFKDVENWHTWASGIKKAYRTPGTDWGLGFKFKFVPKFMPVPMEVPIIDYQENRVIAWGIRKPMATIIHRFDFEAIDDQRCRVRHTEFAEGLLAILSRPMKNRIEEFDRGFADDLQAVFQKTAGRA